MIVKANDIKGLPVISIDSGKRLEDVDSAIYDPETHTILGLVVKPKGMFSDPQVIDLKDVREIGKDVVTVQHPGVITAAKQVSDKMYSLIQMDKHFLHNSIVTEDGEKIGKISDFYFDSHSGVVDHFEVSQGLLSNAASGKKSILPADIITLGQDVTVVKTQTKSVIKDQEATQGIAGKLNNMKQKTSLQMEDLMDKSDHMKQTKYTAPAPYTPAQTYVSMHEETESAQDNLERAKDTVVQN